MDNPIRNPDRPPRRRRRLLRRAPWILLALVVAPPLLFVFNGVVIAPGETPVVSEIDRPAAPSPKSGDSVTVLAYNIAKAFIPAGGYKFVDVATARRNVAALARTVANEKPDIVFLSEAVFECGPCPGDQVLAIAESAGLRYRVYGENYDVGFPGYRMAGGNAILSRFPLTPVANFPLRGRRPFWVTTNNRRALFCSLDAAGSSVLLGAMHTDSFSRENNGEQMRQILGWIGDRPAMLAGDFNAEPRETAMRLVNESGRFSGPTDGPPTLKAMTPHTRIDYVLAPRAWEHVSTRVVPSDASDHDPIVAVFRVR